MLIGWLINDKLTCIPGTKTFWHNLLENIDGLENHCIYPFSILNEVIDIQLSLGEPDYIIRNASFFYPIKTKAKTISFLQDIYKDGFLRKNQIDVINNSDFVIFNSSFTAHNYIDIMSHDRYDIIPIGTDTDVFYVTSNWNKNKPILYIGDDSINPKGFDKLMSIVNNCEYNFIFIMKNDFTINHERIKVYNKISAKKISEICNQCSMLLCTSAIETLHLAGVEAGLCGLPILATNTGIYYNSPGEWGLICDSVNDFLEGIQYVRSNYLHFNPVKYFLNNGYSKNDCILRWKQIINKEVYG